MPKRLSKDSHPRDAATPGAAVFGERLKAYRVRAGLSQELLAERAQISAGAVSALERGIRRMPYRSTVSLLVKALHLNEEDSAELEATRRDARQSTSIDLSGHLPAQRTSFVGRDADIARIVQLLGTSRLVTITGSGGIGKTRAALEAARSIVETQWDEAWFVDLAPVIDGAFIAPKIAATIQPPLTARIETISDLASALAKRRMLLILDNCEHLVADAAAAVDTLLAVCPHMTILATSRETFGIAGEFVYRLQSLTVPKAVLERFEDAHAYSAIDLFIQRAEEADPRAAFNTESLDGIVNVTRRLNGVPLAIELAAAQLPLLGLQTLQARLSEQFNIPARRRDLPRRQQTVIATIRWSYDLLTDDERDLLCSVSIFSGGFTLAAAEEVCVHDAFSRSSVLPALASLVNKSLVNVEQGRDSVRYTLLDSVRSFGLEQLREAGGEISAARRHAQWLAEIADRISYSADHLPANAMAEFLPEFDNVRAAISWSLNASSQDDRGFAGRIITGLVGLWDFAGRRHEHRQWVELALEHIDETYHPSVVAQLLLVLINRACFERATLSVIDRAIPLFERVGDGRAQARFHSLITAVLAEHEKLEEAQHASERAFELMNAEQMQNTQYYCALFTNRSVLRTRQRRFDDARADVAKAKALALSLGNRYFVVVTCYFRLAHLEYAAGNARLALSIAQRMLDSEFGAMPNVAIQALELATNLQLQLGEVNAAADSTRELLGPTRRDESFTHPCEYVATVVALRGHGAAAARLLGFLQAREKRVPIRRSALRQATHDLLCSAIREQLSSEALAAIAADGAQLTAEQAIAEALADFDLQL